MKTKGECPCGSGKGYKECCKPFHKGHKLPKTAEALMRSRYSAFVKNLHAYLIDTWHPIHCPVDFDLDPEIQWLGLEILSSHLGQENDFNGSIIFTVHYEKKGMIGTYTEESEFIRVSGRWLYLKGELRKNRQEKQQPTRMA